MQVALAVTRIAASALSSKSSFCATLSAPVTESMAQLDATGEHTLRRIVENVRSTRADVYFTRAKEAFIAILERTGTLEYVGRDHFFDWNQHALDHLWDKELGPSYRARSPLHVATPTSHSGIWAI